MRFVSAISFDPHAGNNNKILVGRADNGLNLEAEPEGLMIYGNWLIEKTSDNRTHVGNLIAILQKVMAELPPERIR